MILTHQPQLCGLKRNSWATFPGIGSLLSFVCNTPLPQVACGCVSTFSRCEPSIPPCLKGSLRSVSFRILSPSISSVRLCRKIWLSKQLFQRQRDLQAKPSKNRVARPGLWLITKHRIQKVASTSLQQKCQVHDPSGRKLAFKKWNKNLQTCQTSTSNDSAFFASCDCALPSLKFQPGAL